MAPRDCYSPQTNQLKQVARTGYMVKLLTANPGASKIEYIYTNTNPGVHASPTRNTKRRHP